MHWMFDDNANSGCNFLLVWNLVSFLWFDRSLGDGRYAQCQGLCFGVMSRLSICDALHGRALLLHFKMLGEYLTRSQVVVHT